MKDFLFEQLPLAVQLRDDATFENFYSAGNELLIQQLDQQLSAGERYIYLYGSPRSGRSHLLQAACHKAQETSKTAIYLPLKELASYDPESLLEGVENSALLCLDDVDVVIGQSQWQAALFNAFNRLMETDVALLIASSRTVRELSIELGDLQSRLSWGSIFQLHSLNDEEMMEVLISRGSNRGLVISLEVAQFIIQRCARDMETLMLILDQLDKASLRDQRKLTKPFVKEVLSW